MDNESDRNMIISELNSLESQSLMKRNLECTIKSSEKSEEARKIGNKLYCKYKFLDKVFRYYTQSIALAPLNSEHLAFAYGNRSALLNSTKKYKESILDIDRAIAINKTNVIYKIKLLCRKVHCLAALGSPNTNKIYNEIEILLPEIIDKNFNYTIIYKAKDALNNIRKFNDEEVKEISEHMKILSTKEDQNPFDFIDIQCNKQVGRCLVSTCDIKPGEIMFVEKADLKFWEQKKYLNYCGHCFSKSWTNIPCDYCNWCMFCSEECKNLAWKNYHDIECITISQLLNVHEIDNSDFLSLRSLIMRIKELGSIANFKADSLKFVHEFIDYKRSTQDTKSNLLNTQIIKPVVNSCHTVKNKLLTKYAITAVKILIILTKKTSLFNQSGELNNVSELQKNEDILFIGSVFLKLRRISEQSSHIIHNENSVNKLSKDYMICKASNCSLQGAYIPPISSSILHSSNPNTKICITDNQKLIIFALQPIKKNSPLFVSCNNWFIHPFKENSILRNTKSTSHCEACTQKWSNLLQLYKMPMENPFSYATTYNQKESDLYDKNDLLVSSILNGKKVQFNQSTIKRLSKAIDEASNYLNQPSIVICELMICLNIVFNRLYGTDKMC